MFSSAKVLLFKNNLLYILCGRTSMSCFLFCWVLGERFNEGVNKLYNHCQILDIFLLFWRYLNL